jgi:hypothetical protein
VEDEQESRVFHDPEDAPMVDAPMVDVALRSSHNDVAPLTEKVAKRFAHASVCSGQLKTLKEIDQEYFSWIGGAKVIRSRLEEDLHTVLQGVNKAWQKEMWKFLQKNCKNDLGSFIGKSLEEFKRSEEGLHTVQLCDEPLVEFVFFPLEIYAKALLQDPGLKCDVTHTDGMIRDWTDAEKFQVVAKALNGQRFVAFALFVDQTNVTLMRRFFFLKLLSVCLFVCSGINSLCRNVNVIMAKPMNIDNARWQVIGFVPALSDESLARLSPTKKGRRDIQLQVEQLCLYCVLRWGRMLTESLPLSAEFLRETIQGRVVLAAVMTDMKARENVGCIRSLARHAVSRESCCVRHTVKPKNQGQIFTRGQLRALPRFCSEQFLQRWDSAITSYHKPGSKVRRIVLFFRSCFLPFLKMAAEAEMKNLGVRPFMCVLRRAAFFDFARDIPECKDHLMAEGLGLELLRGFVRILRTKVCGKRQGVLVEDAGTYKKGDVVDIERDTKTATHFLCRKGLREMFEVQKSALREKKDGKADALIAQIDSYLKELLFVYKRSYPSADPVSLKDLVDEGMFRRAATTDLMLLFVPFVLAWVLPVDLQERDWIIKTFVAYNDFSWTWSSSMCLFSCFVWIHFLQSFCPSKDGCDLMLCV